MIKICVDLVGNLPAAKLAYTQFDKIALVFPNGCGDFTCWGQKLVSLSASFCGVHFYNYLCTALKENPEPAVAGFTFAEDAAGKKSVLLPRFDACLFIVPSVEECLNNLLWRCRDDAVRNAVSNFA